VDTFTNAINARKNKTYPYNSSLHSGKPFIESLMRLLKPKRCYIYAGGFSYKVKGEKVDHTDAGMSLEDV
jgi:hypothetical protein